MTLPELILWKKISDRNIITVKFRRQHPIGNYIVDFYCHKLKLAIEIDGEIHQVKKQKEYDLQRSEKFNKQGITIIRFTNYQVIYDLRKVVQQIQNKICELSPLQGTIPTESG